MNFIAFYALLWQIANMTKFNEIMRNHRISNGLSMDEVAKKAGCNRSSVWACENGKSVRGPLLRRILDAMGIKKGSTRDQIISLWAADAAGVRPGIGADLAMAFQGVPKNVVDAVIVCLSTKAGRDAIVAAAKKNAPPPLLDDEADD